MNGWKGERSGKRNDWDNWEDWRKIKSVDLDMVLVCFI